MKHKIWSAGPVLLLLAACGGGGDTPGQPSAEERQQLDNIAGKLDAESDTFDTSADSLVPADGAAAGGNDATPAAANGADADPAGAAAPADANALNAAAPR